MSDVLIAVLVTVAACVGVGAILYRVQCLNHRGQHAFFHRNLGVDATTDRARQPSAHEQQQVADTKRHLDSLRANIAAIAAAAQSPGHQHHLVTRDPQIDRVPPPAPSSTGRWTA